MTTNEAEEDIQVLFDSGIPTYTAHHVLFINGNNLKHGIYKATWNGTEWFVELPEGVTWETLYDNSQINEV